MKFYDLVYRYYNQTYGRGKTGIDPLDYVKRDDSVLILGGGGGREVSRLIGTGASLVAIDNSEGMLSLVDGAEKILGDIFEGPLPFGDGAFNVVFGLHGLLTCCESKDAIRGLLGEVGRVLKSGGIFVAEVPVASYWEGVEVETGEFLVSKVGGVLTVVDKKSGMDTSCYLRGLGEWLDLFSGSGMVVDVWTVGDEWRILARK